MADEADKNQWASEFRREATQFSETLSRLNELVEEFNARGWSGDVDQADLTGENADITPQQISDAVGTVAAVDALWEQGHKTNFYHLYRRS
jgi:hypothetical protein